MRCALPLELMRQKLLRPSCQRVIENAAERILVLLFLFLHMLRELRSLRRVRSEFFRHSRLVLKQVAPLRFTLEWNKSPHLISLCHACPHLPQGNPRCQPRRHLIMPHHEMPHRRMTLIEAECIILKSFKTLLAHRPVDPLLQ